MSHSEDKIYAVDAFDYLVEKERTHFWFRQRNLLLSECAGQWFPDTRKYLEVGCGNGCVLEHFSTTFPAWDLQAVEYFDEGIANARKRLGEGAEILKVDARNLSAFRDLDLVGCFDVLEHIEEDELVMEQVFHSLKPGGGFLITVPQHEALWSARDDYAGHKRRYSRSDMERKLTAAGFEVVFTSSFITLLLPFMFASRRLAPSSAATSRKREFQLPAWLNNTLAIPVKIERSAIRRGISLPVGGSLLAIACKPDPASPEPTLA